MRLGLGTPKALAPLAGRPILDWSLDAVLGADVDAVVVAAPEAHLPVFEALVAARRSAVPIRVLPGGATRQASVAAALGAVEDDIVLVHDAARPLTPSSLFDAVRAAVAAEGSGVVPALRPADTVKRVAADGAVLETLDRSVLAAVQTPQGFPAERLRAAYAAADREHTDDASLFAAAGGAVRTIEGEPSAFKITTPWDLRRAEQLLAPVPVLRTGIGVDVHAVDPGRPLHLGGLAWPGEAGPRRAQRRRRRLPRPRRRAAVGRRARRPGQPLRRRPSGGAGPARPRLRAPHRRAARRGGLAPGERRGAGRRPASAHRRPSG